MNKTTFRRYSKTTIRDKRSLIRSLNSFSKQYKYISIEHEKRDYKDLIVFGKLMVLSFSQDTKRIIGKSMHGSRLIYSSDVSNNDLSSHETVLNSIDNLISINSKYEYKKALKSILEDYSSKGISSMLQDKYEDTVRKEIENRFKCSSIYAKKIYNQLKSRIKFKDAGLYSVNDADTNKVHTLTPRLLTSYDILKSRLEYILRRDWLLDEPLLNELKSRLSKFNVKEDYYEEHKKDLTDVISSHFKIDIYKTDDDIYFDAIELLKSLYFKELNEASSHKYAPYQYELTTEYAQNNFKDKSDAIEYIYAHNVIDLGVEEVDDIQELLDKEEALERSNQIDNAPIDMETVQDTSLKEEFREASSSIGTQWNRFYDGLLDDIRAENQDDNEYFILHTLANELVNEHKELTDGGMFLENGSINEYSKYLQSFRQELLAEFKSSDNDEKHKKVSKIISIKKREWKLLNDTINTYGTIYAFEGFNYKTLEYIG